MKKDNLTLLLEGTVLVKELVSNHKNYRTWIEIALQLEVDPSFIFINGHYKWRSDIYYPYATPKKICEKSKSKFRIRQSYFSVEDIENGYDPCYKRVGEYKYIDSIDDLFFYLVRKNLQLDDFISVSLDDDYPL